MDHVPTSPPRGGVDQGSVPSVRAVERAMAILKSFTPQRPRLGLSEVAQAVGLDRGTARRILLTLVDGGVVTFDPERKTYALALSVLEIAAAVPDARSLREAAVPIMATLAGELQLTAFLATVRDRSALCLERVNGLPEMEIRWWPVGSLIPLNCGGAPRVLLAHLPEDEFEAVLATKTEVRTPMTEWTPEALRRSRRRIVDRGWELAMDDFVVGISGVGVPIRDAGGTVIAAISLSGLTPSVVGEGSEPRCLPALRAAATRLEAIARTIRTGA